MRHTILVGVQSKNSGGLQFVRLFDTNLFGSFKHVSGYLFS